jgi:transposase
MINELSVSTYDSKIHVLAKKCAHSPHWGIGPQPLLRTYEVANLEYTFVGIDVSKDKFDVCIKDSDGQMLVKRRSYQQIKRDMDRLIEDIKTQSGYKVPLLGMESTGIYHRNLLHYLIDHGLHVRVYNPIEIHALRQRRIRKTKTDKIDAEVIADAVKLDLIEDNLRFNADPHKLELKELAVSYHRIVEKISVLKLELRTALSILCPGYGKVFDNILSPTSVQVLRKSIKYTRLFKVSKEDLEWIFVKNSNRIETRQSKIDSVLYAFENTTCPEHYKRTMVMNVKQILGQYETLLEQRKQTERYIEKAMKEYKPYALTIPGIGNVTGATILGMLGDVNRFKNKDSVAAYAGLDPVVSQSGKMAYRYGHISRRGNKYLRTALLNATMVAIRSNPVIRQRYHKLRKRNKSHWTAIIACARKMAQIVYSVEKNQKKFSIPKYVDSN